MKAQEIAIKSEFIKLDSLLKFSGICMTGGEAKTIIEEGIVFSREGDTMWQCSNCGHILVGKKAPELCPVCAHPKAYFEIKKENY